MAVLKFSTLFLSVSLTFATTNYNAISRDRSTEQLRPDNFDTFRLPNDTRALTYDVSVRTWIDEANFTFTGTVRIGIIAEQSTNTITLHHRELTIETITLLSAAGDPIEIGSTSYDPFFEFLTIPVASNLTAGFEYTIVISYRGILQNTWRGFYALRYTNSEGRDVYYASTQFEATDARHGFPCYDEIGRKSLYTIRITHSPTYFAIANMPATPQSPSPNPDGSVTTVFETTPLISPSFVAYHVSDFAYSYSSAGSVPHRVLTRPAVVNRTSTALDDSQRMLDAFSERFGVAYALPKMDSVGLPAFGGAMENFGMITYSETYMLHDENVNDEQRFGQVEIVAHEQAHQWFGNAVTPTWWTYAWMKEGFATLFHSFGMDLIYPDWNIRDYMVVKTVQNMLRWEAYYGYNRPMTHYVESPQDINSVFDNVSYSKAASVLRMFLFAFGEDTFMEALRIYLETHKFSDVTEEDFFEALADAVRDHGVIVPPTTNVAEMLSSWTRQAGYPLITVERNYSQGTNQVTLTQARYFYPSPPIEMENTTYWLPYNYATPNDPGFNDSRAIGWISQHETSIIITVDALDADDYFLLDTMAGGYYRILYDERNYRLISDAMVRNPEHFHATSKSSLLDNVRQFFSSEQLTIVPVLDVLRVLEDDANYIVWYPVTDLINRIDDIFAGHQNYPLFRDFVRELVESLYDSVRVEDVSDEPILRKPTRTSRLLINRLLRSLLPSTNENNIEYRVNEAYQVLRSIYQNGIDGLDLALDLVMENAVEAYETFGGYNFLLNIAESIRGNAATDKFREVLQIYLDAGLITAPMIYTIEDIMFVNRNDLEQYGGLINEWLLSNYL